MRILGIDHGTKRIGLAIADDDAGVAVPFGVIMNRGAAAVIAELQIMIAKEGIEKIIVGMPFALKEDRVGEQEPIVRAFLDALRSATTVPIEEADERFTTTEATARALDVPQKQRVQKDAAAATILLQAYIDAHA